MWMRHTQRGLHCSGPLKARNHLNLAPFVLARDLGKAMKVDQRKVLHAAGVSKYYKKYSFNNSEGKRLVFTKKSQITVPYEVAANVATKFGYTTTLRDLEPTPWFAKEPSEDARTSVTRAPVVMVAGHVDHGKTTLLDALRGTKVAEFEVAGITQSVAAFEVATSAGNVTFIDTPGHEAFFRMRSNSAVAADMILLMVAVDEGVQAQTEEVLSIASELRLPVVVALNKVDLVVDAVVEAVAEDVARAGAQAQVKNWDQTLANGLVPVSATTHHNLESVVAALAQRASFEDIHAHPGGEAQATVFELSASQGRGLILSTVVHTGTLRAGQDFVYNTLHGRIREVYNQHGTPVEEAGPGQPALIVGAKATATMSADEIPMGEVLHVSSKREAEAVVKARLAELEYQRGLVLGETLSDRQEDGGDVVPVILKSDSSGTLQTFVDAIAAMEGVQVVQAGVGDVTRSDVNMAIGTSCPIFCFNVQAKGQVAKSARENKIPVHLHGIYHALLEDVVHYRDK